MGAAAWRTPTQSFDKRQSVVLSELLSDQKSFCENRVIGSIIDDNFYSRLLPHLKQRQVLQFRPYSAFNFKNCANLHLFYLQTHFNY